MIYSSTEGPIHVPAVDIVSYCFDKQTDYDETKPILIDADEPSRSLSAASLKILVQRLIAGFRALGLQEGDCVLCQIPNTVSVTPPFYASTSTVFLPAHLFVTATALFLPMIELTLRPSTFTLLSTLLL